jgi:hypothetical protein
MAKPCIVAVVVIVQKQKESCYWSSHLFGHAEALGLRHRQHAREVLIHGLPFPKGMHLDSVIRAIIYEL